MLKRIGIIMLCILLALSGCSKKNNDVPEKIEPEEQPIEYQPTSADSSPKDSYTLTAESADSRGIDINTSFKLHTENEKEKEFIEQNLRILPEQEFKVEEVSKKEFNIIPLTSLKNNAVYKVEMELPNSSKNYSWAFQTKKQFEITGTLPSNDSMYVPLDSGIEIYFTYDNVEKIDEYFEIEPKVEGKFVYDRNTAVFVPDKLYENTTYTVKIKEGLGVKNSALKMDEGYTFSFTTIEEDQYFFFNSKGIIYNFTEEQSPVISVGLSKELANEEFDINIYKYNSADEMLKDIEEYEKTHSFELYKEGIPSNLSKVQSFNQTPIEIKKGYSSFYIFTIPEKIEKGHYLVEYINKDKKYYHYIQINNLLVYNAGFDKEQITCVSDSRTNVPIVNANVQVEDSEIVKTNGDGIAVTNYVEEKNIYYYNHCQNFTVEAEGYEKFIGRSPSDIYYGYYGFENVKDSQEYWKYMYTDRSKYLPDDTINIWGYINPKTGEPPKNLKLHLISDGWGKHEIDVKEVKLSSIGTFEGSFSFEGLTPGSYYICLRSGENDIICSQMDVCEYTKPLYKLSGGFNKEYISLGESIKFNVECNFFDGTPVSSIDLGLNYYSYRIENSSEFNKTNKDGKSEIVVTPETSDTSWYPININCEIYNKNAEDQEVRIIDNFTLLPKDKMIEIEMHEESEDQYAEILFHELDSSKYNKNKDFQYKDMRGVPLDETLHLKITEEYYVKTLNNEYYDYINKVNKKIYDYEQRSRIIRDEDINTVNGRFILDCNSMKNSNSNYEIEVSYKENENKIVEHEHYRYSYRGSTSSDKEDFYSLEIEEDIEKERKLKTDETYNYYLACNDYKVESTQNDRLLVLTMQKGLLDYEILEDTQGVFKFEEKHIPDVYLKGIYINDGKLIIAEHYEHVIYDYSERNINFKVETDKEDYKPGDEVTLNIEAKDNDGNPCIADINVSVVDEAFFAMYNSEANPLKSIYAHKYITGMLYEFTSYEDIGLDYRGMAEKGGGGDNYVVRYDFKDNALFKSLKTNLNGKATVKFKLPDNLTSWRITYQGVSDKMYAGSGKININTKLPFFVDTILGKTYITKDNPCITIRTFGEQVNKDDEISYVIESVHEGNVNKKTIGQKGKAGEYTNIKLGKLQKGKYKVTVYASNEQYKDAVEQEFEVVDSTVYFSHKKYYKVSNNMKFSKVYSNAEVIFFNESDSRFFECLNDLIYGYGYRLDQLLADEIAYNYLVENFDYENYTTKKQSYKDYQMNDGGIGILKYASSDAEFSAKIASLTHDEFNNEKLKNYFMSILEDHDSDSISVAAAYWGLSTYNEPLLLNIYELLETTELGYKEKLYLALALAEYGDIDGAEKIFRENNFIKHITDTAFVDYDEDETNNLEATALSAVLALKLQDYEIGDKLFNYIAEKDSDYILTNIEKLIYILNRNIMETEQIKALKGELTVKIGGETKKIELNYTKPESVYVTAKELQNIKISNVKSDIGCYVKALGGVNDLKESKTELYTIEKKYKVKEEYKTTFKQSDLVEVIVFPHFTEDADTGYYQITDFVPAGFRYVRGKESHVSIPIEQSGQKLVFRYNHSKDTYKAITYYIQAVQPGTYTSDHTVIKRFIGTDLNYTEQEELVIN